MATAQLQVLNVGIVAESELQGRRVEPRAISQVQALKLRQLPKDVSKSDI